MPVTAVDPGIQTESSSSSSAARRAHAMPHDAPTIFTSSDSASAAAHAAKIAKPPTTPTSPHPSTWPLQSALYSTSTSTTKPKSPRRSSLPVPARAAAISVSTPPTTPTASAPATPRGTAPTPKSRLPVLYSVAQKRADASLATGAAAGKENGPQTGRNALLLMSTARVNTRAIINEQDRKILSHRQYQERWQSRAEEKVLESRRLGAQKQTSANGRETKKGEISKEELEKIAEGRVKPVIEGLDKAAEEKKVQEKERKRRWGLRRRSRLSLDAVELKQERRNTIMSTDSGVAIQSDDIAFRRRSLASFSSSSNGATGSMSLATALQEDDPRDPPPTHAQQSLTNTKKELKRNRISQFFSSHFFGGGKEKGKGKEKEKDGQITRRATVTLGAVSERSETPAPMRNPEQRSRFVEEL